MNVPLGEVIFRDCITSSPTTGAASDADSTPTWALYEEDTDTPILTGNMTKRTGKTGEYRATVTASSANGVEVGKWYTLTGYATVGGVVGKTIVFGFRAVLTEAVAGAPVTDIGYVNGTAASGVSGTVDANVVQISGDATAADNLETMLDGTGGQTLSLGSLAVSGNTTFTGTTTHTGAVSYANGVAVSNATANGHGLSVAGNGTGSGLNATGGATGNGFRASGGATSGDAAVFSGNGNGSGLYCQGSNDKAGFWAVGNGTAAGFRADGGGTAAGFAANAGGGNANGITATPAGTGAGIAASITGNVTGNLSGSVGSVTGGATAANQATIIAKTNLIPAAPVAVGDLSTLATAAAVAGVLTEVQKIPRLGQTYRHTNQDTAAVADVTIGTAS
jgi:hypothetical protein